MPRRFQHLLIATRQRLRSLMDETRLLVRAGFALTATERETVVLICALFVLGLVVRWIRWRLVG